MSPPPSDRPLRRLVAELAEHRPADVAAILAALDADQRETIAALVEEYRGAAMPSEAPGPAQASPLPPTIPGLSGWLQARLDGDGAAAPELAMSDGYLWVEDNAPAPFAMTELARAALLDCAAGVRLAEPAAAPASPGLSLFARLRRLAIGGEG